MDDKIYLKALMDREFLKYLHTLPQPIKPDDEDIVPDPDARAKSDSECVELFRQAQANKIIRLYHEWRQARLN
jgi:hypothetical protein